VQGRSGPGLHRLCTGFAPALGRITTRPTITPK
jgi:hypothetical protein